MDTGERARFAAMLADKTPKGPKIVNIHLGNICNLHCNFCWYHSPLVNYTERKRVTTLPVMKAVVDDCADMGVEMISLEADGEVFVVPYCMELIEYILDKRIRLKIFTNATFDPKYTKPLQRVEEFLVNFSVVSKEQYKHIYGKDYFDLVFANLRNMKSKLSIAYVITKDNFETIEYP